MLTGKTYSVEVTFFCIMIRPAKNIFGIFMIGTFLITGCYKQQNTTDDQSLFTKADSLTDNYLSFNDSIIQIWNIMIHDDNQKIKSMRYVLHILGESNEFNNEDLLVLEERLDQLVQNRYTPESLNDASIEEYDFASRALVTEITTLAQQSSSFSENEKLQRKVDEILAAEERVEKYRNDYDRIVEQYNQFLEINKSTIETTEGLDWKKKNQFSYL